MDNHKVRCAFCGKWMDRADKLHNLTDCANYLHKICREQQARIDELEQETGWTEMYPERNAIVWVRCGTDERHVFKARWDGEYFSHPDDDNRIYRNVSFWKPITEFEQECR